MNKIEFTEKLGNVRIKTREFFNPYLGALRLSLGGVNSSFTIISNNCWGGHVYRYFDIPYQSPTVGLYFFADDYVRFCYSIQDYLNKKLCFIKANESKYADILKERNELHKPIGLLGDVEIVFLHYQTQEEAYDKWNRRLSRIDWNNLFFKFSEQNFCTLDHLQTFDKLSTNRKFCFVSKDYDLESQIIFRDYLDQGQVPNDTTNFRKYINLSCFLTDRPFKKRQ